jgi:hypothetical protein
VRAAQARRELLVLSATGKLAYYLSRLAPRWYRHAMVRKLRSGNEVR